MRKENLFVFVLLFLFGVSAMASGTAKKGGHLTQHIEDAILLNSTRLPMYAHLSSGESVKYSKQLIRWEKYALYVARKLDNKASLYQQQGIGIFKDEFISMDKVTAFKNAYPDSIPFSQPSLLKGTSELLKQLKLANKVGNWETIQQLCEQELLELTETPRFYCMYRHLLESVKRAAFYAPLHIEKAKKVGWASTEDLSKKLIQYQLLLLKRAQKFDVEVLAVQIKGVPIIYQDLPESSVENEYIVELK